MPTETSDRTTSGDDQSRWLAAIPVVGLAASIVVSYTHGLPSGLIVMGATVLLIAIWNLWVSLQVLAGDRPAASEGFDPGAPSTEQEQKAFLLRALEDLEFEHAVGKIVDEDYDELKSSYREQAKTALATGNREHPKRATAERMVEQYLEKKGLGAASDAPAEPRKGSAH